MAFENSIGSAMALGTLAHPDNTKVFTNAVMNKQKLDLLDEARKAKEAAAAKKLHDEMLSKVTIGQEALLPIYQKDAAEITARGMADGYAAARRGDWASLNQAKMDAEAKLKGLKQVSDEQAKILNDNTSYASTNPEVRSAFYNVNGRDSIAQLNKKNPHFSVITGIDQNNGMPTLNNVKQINQDTYFKELNSSPNEFDQPVFENGKHKFTQTANSRDYQWQQSPAMLKRKTEISAQNKDLVANIALSPQFVGEVEKVSKDPKNANLTSAQIEDVAMNNIIYHGHNKTVGKSEGIYHPPERSGNEETGVSDVTPNAKLLLGYQASRNLGDIKDYKGNVITPAHTSNEIAVRESSKGSGSTFKPVKVQTGGSSTIISTNDNNPVNFTDVSEHTYGQMVVKPTVKGKVVPDSFLQNPEIAKQVKWAVFATGTKPEKIPQVNDKGKITYTTVGEEPIYRPISEVKQAIYSAQTKAGKSKFQKNLQAHIDEAAQLNGETPATTSKGKTISSSLIKSKVGTKGYEGYSEKELKDYYISQGYTVK